MLLNKLITLIALIMIILLVKTDNDKHIIMILSLFAIICILFDKETKMEGFTDAEAIANLASMYNTGEARIPKLLLVKDGVIASENNGIITLKGNVVIDGTLSTNNNITTKNITVSDNITSNKNITCNDMKVIKDINLDGNLNALKGSVSSVYVNASMDVNVQQDVKAKRDVVCDRNITARGSLFSINTFSSGQIRGNTVCAIDKSPNKC